MTPWLLAALFAAPPIKGRPDDFIGAVGKFSLSAEIRPMRFRVDETATLTLNLEGAGDLSQVQTPDLTKNKTFAERFDVVGPASRRVEKSGVQFTYPIRARSVDVKAIPSIRLSIYDDSPPRPQYRLLRTAEIPIEITPVPARDAASAPRTESPLAGPSLETWTPVVVVLALCAVAVWYILRAPGKPVEHGSFSPTKRRRGKSLEKPAIFIRSEGERWIDEVAEALSLPTSRRTSTEILAATERLGLDGKFIEELKRNLAAADASRFSGAPAAAVNEEELQAINSEIHRLVAGNAGRSTSPRS